MTTLLTGATGLVGSDWLTRLLASRPDRQILALSRNPARVPVHPRVQVIAMDLARPGPAPDIERSVNEIIHCAAEIRFGLPIEEARATNVEGTRWLLDFARRCPKLEKFAHVSSVYAAGKETGEFFEEPLHVTKGFVNTYQQSKYEAEERVLEATAEIPAAIYRLSSIIGDSRGSVRQFNYFHQLIKMIPRSNIVRAIPGDPAAPVDLIASDWAGAATAYLFEHHFHPGRIYHVCAGPNASLTVKQLVEITFEIFQRHPRGRRFAGVKAPELVSLEEFERYCATLRTGRDGTVTEMLRLLDQFMPHLALYQAFCNPKTSADLAHADLAPASIRESYPKVVEYCLDTDWGRTTIERPS